MLWSRGKIQHIQHVLAHGPFNNNRRMGRHKIERVGRYQPPRRHKTSIKSNGRTKAHQIARKRIRRQPGQVVIWVNTQRSCQAACILGKTRGQIRQISQAFLLLPDPEQGLLRLSARNQILAGRLCRQSGCGIAIRFFKAGEHGHF